MSTWQGICLWAFQNLFSGEDLKTERHVSQINQAGIPVPPQKNANQTYGIFPTLQVQKASDSKVPKAKVAKLAMAAAMEVAEVGDPLAIGSPQERARRLENTQADADL